jgi:hypothetical protein
MGEQMELLTTSRMRCFKTCRKQHWYSYELGIRPAVDRVELRFGTAMHAAIELLESQGLDAAEAWLNSTETTLDPYYATTATALIRAYALHWANHLLHIEPYLAEYEFKLPLINPDTGAPSRTFQLAGKIDLIGATDDGRRVLRETKTTGETPDDKYWLKLLIDPQVTLYWLAAIALDLTPDTIIYDVVRKPSMRPAMATPIEARKYKKDGTLYANQRERNETPDEWRDRLQADVMERPEFYLARREIPRLESDLDLFRHEVWDIAKDLRQAQLTGRWYRSPGMACDWCPYQGLCYGLVLWEPESGEVPEGFQKLQSVHPELEELNNASSTTEASA